VVKTAVVTFVYNELINLPIWVHYYSANFGANNLFVVDRGSDDGSTTNLGGVNVIPIPRGEFDEHRKTGFINSVCRALLYVYDTVIYNDCDELVVPDLSTFVNLRDYIERREFEYVSCIGLNVLHMLSQEGPLDLEKPILSQRKYARFGSDQCKTSVTRVPLTWKPGFHCCDRPPNFDPSLYLFHNKWMDYTFAMRRQRINRDSIFSQRMTEARMGAHWHYGTERFAWEGFFKPLNQAHTNGVSAFEFSAEIATINASVSEKSGVYYVPMNIRKLVEIPEHLKAAY
jgi:hypothetical protein